MAKKKTLEEMTPEEKLEHIHKKLKSSKKNLGIQAKDLVIPVTYLKTGSLYLDYVLGGGFQMGRFHEVWGDESSGKTTACLQVIAEAQAQGHIVGVLDAEYSWSNEYAEQLGVDLDRVFVVQEDRVEKGTEIVKEWIDAGIRVIVVDSVAALRPLKEIKDDPSVTQFAGNSKAIARFCYQIRGPVAQHGVCLIAINQVRINMGKTFSQYDEHRAPGGKVWQHAIATSTQFYRLKDMKDSDYDDSQEASNNKSELVIGHETMAISRKNKLGNVRGRRRRLYFNYSYGLDTVMEVFQSIKKLKLIEGGSWITFTNERGEEEKVHGATKMLERLREDIDLYEFFATKVQEAIDAEIARREEERLAGTHQGSHGDTALLLDSLSEEIPDDLPEDDE